MQTTLAASFANTPDGLLAQEILSKCVHCGFCTATCPTYQLLGDELDGPRGRIYLIKQMVEGQAVTEKTRLHLDRCLTCRNCESTCPSGVDYGHLIEVGRHWVEKNTPARPLFERLLRKALAYGLTNPGLFNTSLRLGRLVKPLLPQSLKSKIPQGLQSKAPTRLQRDGTEQVLMLDGCVQPGMLPNINHATVRVLQFLGVDLISAPKVNCCGAIKLHLNEHDASFEEIKRNIDAWWPYLSGEHPSCHGKPIKTILMNASGCGSTVKEYGHLLRRDPAYAEKAAAVSRACQDIVEFVPRFSDKLTKVLGTHPKTGVVYHPPCTLQHGQKIKGQLEKFLGSLGITTHLCEDSHLCCGSAGTYSILQAELSEQLKKQKLNKLIQAVDAHKVDKIVSGNVGCITQLQNSDAPVMHWIELIDSLLLAQHAYDGYTH